MHKHHKRAHPHKVGAVGEADEEYGGDVVDHLLLEVLRRTRTEVSSILATPPKPGSSSEPTRRIF